MILNMFDIILEIFVVVIKSVDETFSIFCKNNKYFDGYNVHYSLHLIFKLVTFEFKQNS